MVRGVPPEALYIKSRQVLRDRQTRLPLPVFVKIQAPGEVNVELFSAGGKSHAFPNSVTVGMRAIHRYAFALSNVSGQGRSNQRYWGTIEVLRGPKIPINVKASDAPVPLRFNEEDVSLLARERMLTKVIVLEDPDLALPVSSNPDEPVRLTADVGADPIKLAKGTGELVLVVRIGTRIPSSDELASATEPGSLLIPQTIRKISATGEEQSALAFVYADTGTCNPPQRRDRPAPHFSAPPSAGMPGPKSPAPPAFPIDASGRAGVTYGPGLAAELPLWDDAFRDEYLCDGGDQRPKVGRNLVGDLVNVDPSDTVAEYETAQKRRYTESNRVCVVSPRYAEVTQALLADGYISRLAPGELDRDRNLNEVVQVEADALGERIEAPQGIRMRERASEVAGEQWASEFSEVRVLDAFNLSIGWAAMIGSTGPKDLTGAQNAEVIRRVQFVKDMTQVQFPQAFGLIQGAVEVRDAWKPQVVDMVEPPPKRPGRLILEKSASTSIAKIGDVVGFIIKYTNTGEAPITDLAVVDSLLSRLEYVPGSALSSREAVFTTQDNEVGSSTLRWEIPSELKGGESGMVYFKAKVR
jgi:uncharacterized repeat protein (TIGR01451 family)